MRRVVMVAYRTWIAVAMINLLQRVLLALWLIVLLTSLSLTASPSTGGLYIGQPLDQVRIRFPHMKPYGRCRYQCTSDLHASITNGRVSEIILVTDAFMARGVRVGDSRESVIARMGKPSRKHMRALDNHAQIEEIWTFPELRLVLLLGRWRTGWRVDEIRIH